MSADTYLSYLDRLPIHPPPETLESLTGYITRLAQENAAPGIESFVELLFPHEGRYKLKRLDDVPRMELQTLSIRTGCPVERLQQTTLYHAARKFERDMDPNSAGQFFLGALGECLRYCPSCLDSAAFYRLPWRFLALEGCPFHEVALLDVCGHCGEAIPLLAPNLRIAICSACGGDIRRCASAKLIPSALKWAQKKWADMVFLLAPKSWEGDTETGRKLGQKFSRLRRDLGLSGRDVAARIGTTVNRIYKLENGYKHGTEGPFVRYLAYADLLGLSLREIFATPPDSLV